MKPLSEEAVSLFLKGYACSESVLLAFSKHYGIKSELIPRIATAFGGGFGRKGLVCGCVTGALMTIGLKFGRTDTSQSNAEAYEVTRKFCEAFKERFGSLFCRELTEIDLTTEEGRRIFAEKKVGEEKCVNFVKESVLILLDLIEKQRS
ncbi:MAG: C-GCAxxG-C-C family protein [Thermoproteota archaeon]